MIIMHTSDCRPGMKLGRALYTEHGHVLAGRGFILTEHAIKRLKQAGFSCLHIEERGTEDIAPDLAVRDETLIVLHGALTHVVEEIAQGAREKLSANVVSFLYDAAKLLTEDMKARRDELILPVNLATMLIDGHKQHFLEHAINVAVCATRLGLEEGLAGGELEALTMGALLHDVGRLLLPNGLKSSLPEDPTLYKSHPELGYKLLRDSGLPLMTALCALFHHERVDGSGYPLGLKGDRVHPVYQWVGIFDLFDSLVNGRENRELCLPHEVLEIMYGNAGTLFDLDKVRRLRDSLVPFPRGTSVRLSTGELGVVSALHRDTRQRPIVRVIRSSEGQPLAEPYEVDLKRRLDLMISGIGGLSVSKTADSVRVPKKERDVIAVAPMRLAWQMS
ncbi:HD-GYP domain-containing protein [Paenibacillaceae bacterium WGS1546]|uniref:HD-GYP domain-containing protein n=1 Tax=Cohnella sp. WGS1546 TaxID=3366810 RepID=UPI00372D7DCD